jgi:hypothetical protein
MSNLSSIPSSMLTLDASTRASIVVALAMPGLAWAADDVASPQTRYEGTWATRTYFRPVIL